MYERHNETKTRLYYVWKNMKNRCYNKNNKRFTRYGARGVIVCEEWKNNYLAFKEWAIANGYADNLTIDRIDNNGNYEPANCQWTTEKNQANNRSTNHYVTYKGETLSLTEWCEKLNIGYEVTKRRLARGWNIDRAFETPVQIHYKKGA